MATAIESMVCCVGEADTFPSGVNERERERELPDFPFWEIRVCLWVDRSLASSLDVLLRGVAVVIEPVFIGVNHFVTS